MSVLFVYGTLKTGFNRHHALQDERYLGTAVTQPEYRMFAYGGFPALVSSQSPGADQMELNKSAHGEIWEVSQECLRNLDHIEGVDTNLFARLPIKLQDITLFRLPLFKSSWDMLQSQEVQSYVFMQKINGAAELEGFWARK
jgi:gamma-glutamylcyclotransferase (GGCT)/AIG2-like uncharacterized protein YtfP